MAGGVTAITSPAERILRGYAAPAYSQATGDVSEEAMSDADRPAPQLGECDNKEHDDPSGGRHVKQRFCVNWRPAGEAAREKEDLCAKDALNNGVDRIGIHAAAGDVEHGTILCNHLTSEPAPRAGEAPASRNCARVYGEDPRSSQR